MTLSQRQGPAGAVVFLFSAGARHPVAVLKSRPSGPGGARLTREGRALCLLARTLPASLQPTVPRVLARRREQDTELLLLTGLPCRSAYADLHRDLMPHRRVPVHFRHAARWLAQLHRATSRTARPVDLPELDRIITRALVASRSLGEDRDLTWVPQLREWCARTPIVTVACHGDFWARNLMLVTSAGCPPDTDAGVVDWEHFRPRALPSEDLFHFPLTYGLAFPWSRYRRAGALDAFRQTFLEHNGVSREAARYLRTYCDGTGLDPRLLKPLFHLFLLTRAAGHARAGTDDRAPWLEFNRLLAASRESLFDDIPPGERTAWTP